MPPKGLESNKVGKPCPSCGVVFYRLPCFLRRQNCCSNSCAKALRSVDEKTRFWAKVDKGNPDRCWTWTGARLPTGYGAFRYRKSFGYSHRVSWETRFGPIPKGLFVLHRCDNPPCVNPDHLFLGTAQDNMADMDAKGRRRLGPPKRGETNGNSKLKPSDVIAIRSSRLRQTDLAKQFKVSQSQISDIILNKVWRHLS